MIPRAVRALFTLAVLLGTAGWARAEMCVRLNPQFSGHPESPMLMKTIGIEVSAIWEPYGVHVTWSDDVIASGCDRIDASFDVFIEHRTSALAVRPRGVVLGITHVHLLVIDHAPIHLDYDATDTILQSVTNQQLIAVAGHHGIGSAERGRALGRVLAHEIGHVLLALPNHQPRGLMRSSYLPTDLAAVQRLSFTLSGGEVGRLHQRERVLAASCANGLP
jgi:hypothetical protein